MKLPAIQFYTGDWRKDPGIQALDFESRGVWFEILCLMNESEQRGKLTLKGEAMPTEALARILGISVKLLETVTEKLLKYGVASRETETGVLFNRRMVRDEQTRKKRAEAGKLGGNPVLLNLRQTSKQPSTEPNANPYHAVVEGEDSQGDEGAGRRGAVGWAGKILAAYPRTDAPMPCLAIIQQTLDTGEDGQTMWDQVRECAFHVNRAPGGHANGKMPSAKTFFEGQRWRQPEVLKNRVGGIVEL